MHSMMKPQHRSLVLPLVFLLLTAGCSGKTVTKEIGEFDRSVTAANTAIAAYYGGLNQQELDLYFQLLELDPEMEVGDQIKFEQGGKPILVDSPLKKPPFDSKSIQSRISVLKQVTAYSRGLAELAGADSPSKFQENVGTLKDKLLDLQKNFQSKADMDNDKRAQEYASALSSLVGVVGKWYLDARRWHVIKQAIKDGNPHVTTLLTYVAKDLDDNVQQLLDTGAEDRYTTAIGYYNIHRARLSGAQRKTALQQIRIYKEAWDAARNVRPGDVVRRMQKAHDALVKVAKEDRSRISLMELKAQLELYKDDVVTLIDAVSLITGLKKG